MGVPAPVFDTTIGVAILFTFLFSGRFFQIRFHLPATSSEETPPRDLLEELVQRKSCMLSCSLEVVESIPENVTFGDTCLPKSTFIAWKQLINLAQHNLHIAAYKSSLRGKHVLDMYSPSTAWGEEIFESLLAAGQSRKVNIRMIENYPPKDRGDNEDGMSLARRGVVDRRPLHYNKVFGAGLMHSKFIIADDAHFYLGSANLDWRSLNQKMELGVLVRDCPCLANDLKQVFDTYWELTGSENCTGEILLNRNNHDSRSIQKSRTFINKDNPLAITLGGAATFVYLAASPWELNNEGRTYDLDAIVSIIDSAKKFIYIHVMDYIPMLVYRQPKKYWSVIDDSLRRAVVERGVELKLISAALHFVPENLHFLKSLQSLEGVSKGSVHIKIFKIPILTEFQSVIARDRRTHNKFMVTEESVVIGTSNWSGDYFSGTTGVQIVVNQNMSQNRPFIDQMRQIFVRDWLSPYAHSLTTYISLCLYQNKGGSICEPIRH